MPVPEETEEQRYTEDPVHGYFGLSYANYLVLPRSVLQSMPYEWQEQLCGLLSGLSEHFGGTLDQLKYNVVSRDAKTGRIVSDPLASYRHDFHEPDVPFAKR